MLSLEELRRAARVLDTLIAGHRLQAVAQPDPGSLVLTTYGASAGSDSGRRQNIRLSCRPGFARVSLCDEARGGKLGALAQYAKAHLVGGTVRAVRLVGEDRQLAVDVATREGSFALMLSILGPRSNLVLLDAGDRLVATLRPLSDTRPELSLGEPWQAPASKPPSEGEDRFADEPDERWLAAVEEAYARAESEDAGDGLRRRIEQALRKEEKTLTRKLEKLERGLESARADSNLERQGELLKGVLSKVKRGDAYAVARDYETGEEVRIELDPTKSPAENLEHLFKRYRKAIRTLTKGGAQQDSVREARDALDAERRQFEALVEASDAAGIEAFAEKPVLRRMLAKYTRRAPSSPRPDRPREHKLGGRVVPVRLMPRRYRSAGDLEIWVGRSDEGNDFLSTRLARGNDLFFHLDGAPGSHVVLRTEGRSDPLSEAVLDACELAVHFSKAKKASRADVHVVPIKNVRKPKGAKRGLVTVHGGKTIHLRRSPERLQRVLDARIDDAET